MTIAGTLSQLVWGGQAMVQDTGPLHPPCARAVGLHRPGGAARVPQVCYLPNQVPSTTRWPLAGRVATAGGTLFSKREAVGGAAGLAPGWEEPRLSTCRIGQDRPGLPSTEESGAALELGSSHSLSLYL